MEKTYDFEAFRDIIRQLRAPEGCPWDREQTHMSLRTCLMEEAAEVSAAVRIYEQTGNADNLCEELGDVLLQVMMHSQIAEEEGLFTLEDVIEGISQKMVRRHPHVFADVTVEDSGEVLRNWEEIKKAEKADQSFTTSELRDIPKELPALSRAVKVLKKADKLYKAGEDVSISIAKIKEDLDDFSKENGEENQEKLADILIQIANIARVKHMNAEQILDDKLEELIDSYEKSSNIY